MTTLLRYHDQKEVPLHRLPFLDSVEGKGRLSFWAVPKTGGYCGGGKTGEAMAKIYLKHLRQRGATGGGSLQTIIFDMMGIENDDTPETSALRGQIVGFFVTLEAWLVLAAQKGGNSLDSDCPRDLLDLANYGLNFDEAAYLESLDDSE